MTDRFKSVLGIFRVRKAAIETIEALEPRAYLTGFVLGTPVNTTTAPLGLSPVFANLAPFVTSSPMQDDLFVANTTNATNGAVNSVSVLLSNGDGSFNPLVATIPVAGTPLPLATGDFTTAVGSPADGNLDIVAGTTNTGSPGNIAIILGNGNGTFKAAEEIPALGNNNAIAVGAFIDHGSGAGNLDVITVSNNASNVNNCAIVFVQSKSVVPIPIPFGSVASVATGDFNGDGHLDFAVLNQANASVSVLLGNGDGSFKAATTYATGPQPTSLVVGNFRNKTINGLPELDIVTADSTGGEVSFLANKGDGTFAPPVNSPVGGSAMGGGPLKVRFSDLNGDNVPDLLCLLSQPGSGGDATAMLGNGDGTFHTGTIISTNSGTRTAIAAGDLKGTGLTDVVLTDSSQITALPNITNGDITKPTAVVTLNPPPGSTSSATYTFSVTYSDAQQIDALSLGNGNVIVTAPAGVTFPGGATTEAATLVPMSYSNGPSLTAFYSITLSAPLSQADATAGAYEVTLNPDTAQVVKNANNVSIPFDMTTTPMGLLGSFNLSVTSSNIDTVPPTATVNANPAQGSSSADFYQFNVTYADNVAVNASTISSSNLVVQFPNNSTQAATLVPGQTLSNGTSIQATYEITFPGTLTTANDGIYTVSMNSGTGSVSDTSNNPVTAGAIGTFTLVVTAVQPQGPNGDLTVGPPTGRIPAAVVTGARQTGVRVKVTNNGTGGPIKGPITGTITITLYASSTTIHDASSVALTSITRKVRNFKVGKFFNVVFRPFKYPTTPGLDFLVAEAAIGGTVDSTDGASSSAVNVAAPFVRGTTTINGTPTIVKTTRSTLVAGKRYTAFITVQNAGNVVSTGSAPVTVSVMPTGGAITQIATATSHVHILPGKTARVAVSFTPTNLPVSGFDYTLILSITLPGDSLAASAMSLTLLTI